MTPERQRALLERFYAFRRGALPDRAPESMRNPAAVYTDSARFACELRGLFGGRRVPMGLGCELAGRGWYVPADVGGVPIALVRQADGSLRGFVNACRHRGAPVLSGRGDDLRSITCPYHAWTYA